MGNFEEAARHFGAVVLRTAKTLAQSFYFATRAIFKSVPVFAWLPIVIVGAWAAAPALASITGFDRVPDGVSSIDRYSTAARSIMRPTGSVPSASPGNSASYATVTPQATGGDFGAGGIGGGSFGGSSSSGASSKKHGGRIRRRRSAERSFGLWVRRQRQSRG